MTAPAVETHGSLPILWRPHPGPQTRFLASTAFDVLYGGEAGGGKTDGIVYGPLRQTAHPLYRHIIFRRTFPELQELMDRAALMYPQLGASYNDRDKRWTFPSGGKIEFGYCATYQEALQYQTDEFTGISFDQLDQLPEERIWTYLSSRVRAKADGLFLEMRASANPGGVGGHWIKKRYIDICPPDGTPIAVESKTPDGRVVKHTRAFIRAGIKDNPALLKNDPTYRDRLGLLGEVEYRQLAMGDWEAQGGKFYPEITRAADQDRLFITPSQLPPLKDWYEYWASYDWGFIHPAAFAQFVRIGNVVYWLDTLYLHKYQDEDQAATIKAAAVHRRCLSTVYAGHDAFAKRMAHSASAETVADVFARYSIALEKANIDRVAGAQVMRRLFAEPKPGPLPKGAIALLIVDTVGNRRAMSEFAALVPEETHPNVPAKRDADADGQDGDDGADAGRYGLATPSFEGKEPERPHFAGNVETGRDDEFDRLRESFAVTANGVIDRRQYVQPSEDPRLIGVGGELGENEF